MAKPTLFISLGKSQAIVPEAYLVHGTKFASVRVITTKNTGVELITSFFAQCAPGVALEISRVAGFDGLTDAEDHFLFEEVLYRWILHAQVPPPERYVCLAGGFKTMSAAMQKAAAVLGAQDVFHVIADDRNGPLPETLEQIQEAVQKKRIYCISLGPEGGWPQFRQFRPEDYPLIVARQAGQERWLEVGDKRFRTHLREIVERSHNIANAWDNLPQLPFARLATWPREALGWLGQPLDPEHDAAWIGKLPKVELHCHLGGFATGGELLQEVRKRAENGRQLPALKALKLPRGWPLPPDTIPLVKYMKLGNNSGTQLLKDSGCLRAQCELLYQHLRSQNILYAEIRCSPANYAASGCSPWQVLCAIRQTFQDCMEQWPGCHVNLILIATRRQGGDFRAAISRHLALAITAAEHWRAEDQCRVVGVDLAGYEAADTRAHYFREEFIGIHRCGLAITVHAGENDEAEGIWRAVFDLNARRLGHALHLTESPELMRSVAARGIGIEMCPYANYQIHPYQIPGLRGQGNQRRETYPLRKYLEQGIRVTVNTDNPGISAADLTQNLLLAGRLCPELTRLDILKLQRHALEAAFISPGQRQELARKFEEELSPRLP
ncbi:MAG: hypothetical protein N3J91_07565 [Verrucomicrobiae bacterium]|nr:hypothetical protein [Verrucomicrobiae bacterium]